MAAGKAPGVRWYGPVVSGRVKAASGAGAHSAGRALAERTRPRVPIDTGAMRASVDVQMDVAGDDATAMVSVRRPDIGRADGTIVTIVQHEDTSLNHPRGGEAKFLERSFREYEGQAKTTFAQNISAALR